jgi:hypothetical protein
MCIMGALKGGLVLPYKYIPESDRALVVNGNFAFLLFLARGLLRYWKDRLLSIVILYQHASRGFTCPMQKGWTISILAFRCSTYLF